ncbi:MAG: M1 family aminopeptidase [Bdellovibrionota bacterium]
MSERMICRQCSGGGSFTIAGAKPHYAPDRPFKLEHVLLDVSVEPETKYLTGTVKHRVTAVAPDQRKLKLDQVGLTIDEAAVNGKNAKFFVVGNSLSIELRSDSEPPVAPGEIVEFTVKYSVRQPRRGLFFTGPDADYPKKPYQVWSQGQDEDSRYWFPTFDYPNQKATSEVIATVPDGYTAISNGALISCKEVDRGKRFHYRLGVPHVTYLISLVVGKFSTWSDKGPNNLLIQYFVQPGREEDGKRMFKNTSLMIGAFERKIGVDFPYEKYSQVAVQDFIFGGMENTSATTLTELSLHDERAHLDYSSDSLVAHELAHQWFGDLLTCRDWSHGWLNEGFATFMERVWVEEDKGPNGGFDEAKYHSYQDMNEYLSEDKSRYRRPVVCNTYVEPIDIFDAHLYQKGGLVLNMIRHILGDALFWQSVRNYVNRHKGGNVETLDFVRIIEDTTGRNLRRIFDEWLFNAGYPEFDLSCSWNEDKKIAELVIEQKQTGGQESATKNGSVTPLFHLPVVIDFTMSDGQRITHSLEIGEARERVLIACPSKPLMVRFDPDNWIPKTVKFSRTREMLLYQLVNDPDCIGRIGAAKELAKTADQEVVESLGKAVLKDHFWGVKAEIASILAEIRTQAACDGLTQAIRALDVEHPKARRAIVKALGKFKNEKASSVLRKIAEKDVSYYVEAEATIAWASSVTRADLIGATSPDAERISGLIEEFLSSQLKKDSHRDAIRSASLKAFTNIPGIGSGDRQGSVTKVVSWTKRGLPHDARIAAVDCLGQIAKGAGQLERTRILAVFTELADEDDFRLRMALVGALEKSEMSEAISLLSRIKMLDVDGRVRKNANFGIGVLETARTMPESVSNLKAALEKLEEEQRKLRSMLEDQRVVNKEKTQLL